MEGLVPGSVCFMMSIYLHTFAISRRKCGCMSEELISHHSSGTFKQLEEKVNELSAALEKEGTLRKAERASRINIQKRVRDDKVQQNFDTGFSYVPIGVVRSPFGKRCGTPRQPILCPAAKGKILFNKTLIQAGHFQELKDFSHIWVIWAFHGNTNGDSGPKDVPSKVKPPRCNFRVGCLSTRSPHRPNAIGLSVVQVVSVGTDFIEVCGLDMVDGTPVFDVKPYIPYDIIPFDKPLPMLSWARAEKDAVELKCPPWVYEADIPFRAVLFPTDAEIAIDEALLLRQKAGKKNAYYAANNLEEAKSLISQVLQQDIRGRNSRGCNSSEDSDPTYNCYIDDLLVSFITNTDSISVCDVRHNT